MTYHLHKPSVFRRRLRSFLLLTVLLSGSIVSAAGALTAAAEETSNAPVLPAIIINEVKTGGNNTTFPQYVTLYNQSNETVSLTGWRLEYAKAGFSTTLCTATNWETADKAMADIVELDSSLNAASSSDLIEVPMTDNKAGSVRLVDPSGNVTDLVGWGSTSASAPCSETGQAPMLTNDKTLIRYLSCVSSTPVDSNDNTADFMLTEIAASGRPVAVQLPECTQSSEESQETAESCEGVVISELLPNPAGTDTGHEYIELHNTAASAIDLSACNLQTSANDKLFALSGIILQPGQYQALSDAQSGLTLANSSGGTVWLLDDSEELQAVSYPADLEDDTSWTFADGQWNTSYTPTPGAANLLTLVKPCAAGQIRNTETNRCVTAAAAEESLEPCDPGQERNPETNRCRTVAAAANNAVCPAGQVRNPETNRCRSAALTTNSQAACKPGQERNPETNRCRNVAAVSGSTKPCPTGQERNPETNRCRKISAAASGQNGSGLGGVQDVAAAGQPQNKPYWLIAGVLLLGAIGYAVYEWRQEIRLFAVRQLARFRRPLPSAT